MDADNVILLARCLSNIAGSVYRFAFGYLGQDRGQRSLSARKYRSIKKVISPRNISKVFSFFYTLMVYVLPYM